MFSFIGRWFHKSKKDEDEAETEKPYVKGDPIPYSLDFTNAVSIDISARDCHRKNIEAVGKTLHTKEHVCRVIELLEQFPETGEVALKVDECFEHVLTAHNDEIPFAQVKLYDGNVMLPDGKFLDPSSPLQTLQTELGELVLVK